MKPMYLPDIENNPARDGPYSSAIRAMQQGGVSVPQIIAPVCIQARYNGPPLQLHASRDARPVAAAAGFYQHSRRTRVPDIIRKSDKKPLRVFLVDGRNDNRALRADGSYDQTRDWFYQNVRMQQALTEKGYDVKYSFGIQRHGRKCCGPSFRR